MTDRTLRAARDLGRLDFSRGGGLLPVVAQDAATGRVLMVAYADRTALERSLGTGLLHFHSRSRDALWKKGETSGNTLAIESLHADCDGDAVLALVRPAGPACHTGEATCFGDVSLPVESHGAADGAPASAAEPAIATSTLSRLERTIAERAANRSPDSYTVRLLDDANLRLKKLGEEMAELIVALATADAVRVREESADVLYHVLVALRGAGVELAEVMDELDRRRAPTAAAPTAPTPRRSRRLADS